MTGTIELEIVDVGVVVAENVARCVVRCIVGPVRIGDSLKVDLDNTSAIFRVVEIRYYQLCIRELETNFGGQVVLEGGDVRLLKIGQKLFGLDPA